MFRLLFLLLPLLPSFAFSQGSAARLHTAAQLEAQFREPEALALYQQVLTTDPHNITALCRCADLSCRIGNRESDNEKKTSAFRAGNRYAIMALAVDSTNAEANVVMAFSLARLALIQSMKEKIASATAIRQYALKAIHYDPSNFKAYHVLGRWNYEVSALNGFQRTMVRWIYTALPPASLNDAIADYEKSRSLNPGFMLNYLELAKCRHREKKDKEAIVLLEKMDRLNDGMYDDREVRAEGRSLLQALKEDAK